MTAAAILREGHLYQKREYDEIKRYVAPYLTEILQHDIGMIKQHRLSDWGLHCQSVCPSVRPCVRPSICNILFP